MSKVKRPTSRVRTVAALVLPFIFLWVATAYLGPRTSDEALVRFYHKVRPGGPGWQRIRTIAGISAAEAAADSEAAAFPMSLLGWFAGCITIWSALFTVGNFLY